MKILIVGLGVIGSTYGYLFRNAGHQVEHLIRSNSKNSPAAGLNITLLDGRTNPKGEARHGTYSVKHAEPGENYDFIFISVPAGKLSGVMISLKEQDMHGAVLVSGSGAVHSGNSKHRCFQRRVPEKL